MLFAKTEDKGKSKTKAKNKKDKCTYCKKSRHTQNICWKRKADEVAKVDKSRNMRSSDLSAKVADTG